ncbi:hypothetical protein BKA62DRAFT_800512 [Auriculariales sp. MPI-PUGE-AT-0066]|nr:hypothetical protein BKA62DRAFT_800512 [Auriculariales sp. MPI-PUGE-AT-0066]
MAMQCFICAGNSLAGMALERSPKRDIRQIVNDARPGTEPQSISQFLQQSIDREHDGNLVLIGPFDTGKDIPEQLYSELQVDTISPQDLEAIPINSVQTITGCTPHPEFFAYSNLTHKLTNETFHVHSTVYPYAHMSCFGILAGVMRSHGIPDPARAFWSVARQRNSGNKGYAIDGIHYGAEMDNTLWAISDHSRVWPLANIQRWVKDTCPDAFKAHQVGKPWLPNQLIDAIVAPRPEELLRTSTNLWWNLYWMKNGKMWLFTRPDRFSMNGAAKLPPLSVLKPVVNAGRSPLEGLPLEILLTIAEHAESWRNVVVLVNLSKTLRTAMLSQSDGPNKLSCGPLDSVMAKLCPPYWAPPTQMIDQFTASYKDQLWKRAQSDADLFIAVDDNVLSGNFHVTFPWFRWAMFASSHSPNMRNRRRIWNICEEITYVAIDEVGWKELGQPQDVPEPTTEQKEFFSWSADGITENVVGYKDAMDEDETDADESNVSDEEDAMST